MIGIIAGPQLFQSFDKWRRPVELILLSVLFMIIKKARMNNKHHCIDWNKTIVVSSVDEIIQRVIAKYCKWNVNIYCVQYM